MPEIPDISTGDINIRSIVVQNPPDWLKSPPQAVPPTVPVTAEYLTSEGLSPKFIDYMSNWGFVEGYDDKMKEALKKA